MKFARNRKLIFLALVVSLLLVWFTVYASSIVSATTLSADAHKLIAPPGSVDDRQEGISLLHDYGAFVLYGIDGPALAQMEPQERAGVELVDEMDMIMIDAHPFNGRRGTPDIPDQLRIESLSGEALQLVQFVGPITDKWLSAVAATGAVPIHYIANNAYLVWADQSGREQMERLVNDADFLQYSALYQPYFKLGPNLRDSLASEALPGELVDVAIQIYEHPGMSATKQLIQSLRIEEISPWTSLLAYQTIIITLRQSDIIDLAFRPDVVWVGEYEAPILTDEVQAQVVAGNLNGDNSTPSGPGYLAWLNSKGFSTDPADYPIIDITDDGIGNGTVDSGDDTLYQFGLNTNASRLAYLANCTGAASGEGVGGHGHLNASIAGGYDTRTGFPYKDTSSFSLGLGINPYGRLAGTRIFGPNYNLSRCGSSLTTLIERTYANGARISSNSWGCDTCAGTYDTTSQLYDAMTRDADRFQPGNQPLTFVFAAGNMGPGTDTIYTPANAKNVITVGGSENVRPNNCGLDAASADSAMDIIGFSSRGPAPGGRYKPEIVAPATYIQGTASTSGSYDGTTVACTQAAYSAYYPAGQSTFTASSGTSHAAPAVSGVLSLYTYWLENHYSFDSPSPAILKAYLMAHPTYLTGVSANDTLPSFNQGFGLPDMETAFNDVSRYLLDQSVVFDNTGESWTFRGSVENPDEPLRIVMAYTDAAGVVGTNPLVNSLAMRVDLGGTAYAGNRFSGQWSSGVGGPDLLNNYEAVYLPAGTDGAFQITVTAYNIAGDGVPNFGDATDQDFALVCYNCVPDDDFELKITPRDQAVCMGADALFDLNVEQLGSFGDPVSLSLTGEPSGVAVSLVPGSVTPPGSAVLTIGNTAAADPGDYRMTVTGTGSSGDHSVVAWLRLQDTPTLRLIQLESPASGVMDVSITPSFSWAATPPADEYQFEIATDVDFTDVAYRSIVNGSSHTIDGELSEGTVYYWRVGTADACGSSYSAASSFRVIDRPGVLLVDADYSEFYPFVTWPDVGGGYTSALDSLDVAYDTWARAVAGTPDAATLANYNAVIWFTGDATTSLLLGSLGGPEAADEAALAAYLDGGGCFLISSMEYFGNRGKTAFMSSYLGVSSAAAGDYSEVIGTGALFGGLGPYALTASPVSADVITPSVDLTNIASAAFSATLPELPSGILRDNGVYRTAYLGFGLEDVDAAGRQEILQEYLSWCTPPPAISIDDASAGEADGTITLTIKLDESTILPVTVDYATADNGSASSGSDYIAASGTVTVPSRYRTATFAVSITDDSLEEGDETFVADLTSAVNGTISDSQAVATIIDNDITAQLSLTAGWNMISGYILPTAADLETMFAPIASQMVLMKNNQGEVFYPEGGINNIGSWDYQEGYQIYMLSDVTLTITGTQVVPDGTPIWLDAGWNMITYLRDTEMAAAEALSSINSDLLLVKDNFGRVYLPEYGINTIGSMLPNQGYQIFMKTAAVLEYPANTAPAANAAVNPEIPVLEHFTKCAANTGNNATVIIDVGAAATSWLSARRMDAGDEIAVFGDGDGICYGAAKWAGAETAAAMAVWGDDSQTDAADGLMAGEEMRFLIWDQSENAVWQAAVRFEAGDGVYQANSWHVLNWQEIKELFHNFLPVMHR